MTALTEKDYSHLVDALLPRGPIWKRRTGSALDAVLFALAKEAARVDARISQVIEESDPRTSIEKLQRWFDDYGIPSECLAALADPSREQMRQELLAKITSNLGLTAVFFEGLAAVLGYTARVTVFQEMDVEGHVENAFYDEKWTNTFSMGITVSGSEIDLLEPDWDVTEPLARWGNQLLECMVNALKPAHVRVIFMYEGGEVND